VTEFGKTNHVCTRIEIHFIAYYNSYTQVLSRHSDTIAIDKKISFYRQLFVNPIKRCRTITDPVGSLGGINKVTCHLKPFYSTSALMLWLGLLWLSVWSIVHTTLSPASEGTVESTHPPSPHSSHLPSPLNAASLILQALFKTCLEISQSIQ